MSEVDPGELVGKTLEGVAASWFKPADRPVAKLVGAWFRVAGVGSVKLHTNSGLRLLLDEPPDSYEMRELHARVDVEENTPAPLRSLVGGVILAMRPLQVEPEGFLVGFVMDTTVGAVAIADIGDDLAIGPWPDASRWQRAGIALRS